MHISRRRALYRLLFGPSLVGLRGLVTGLPASLLMAADASRPDEFTQRARASRAQTSRTPQFVIFSTSSGGDPINCNAPGCYDDPKITHSADPSMLAAPLTLGATTVQAARAWGTLPASMRAQTSFFHHATYTVVHPDQDKVLHVQGATRSGEMLPSVLSKNLAAPLGTLRQAPIDFNDFSRGTITCDGVLQPSLTPGTLASLLAPPGGGLGDANLLALRDRSLDALNGWAKAQGSAELGAIVDEFALSRGQVRTLQDKVVGALQNIRGNDSAAKLQGAVVLFQMKVAPVVMVSFDFGGDNHADPNFANETQAHNASIATLATLPGLVDRAGLTGQVTLCSLNVFGRELDTTNGRSHNDRHAVSLIIGANVRAGVVGGVAAATSGGGYSARNIDSASGRASDAGDIGFADTLASYGKTLVAAAGVPQATVDEALRSGTTVAGALSS